MKLSAKCGTCGSDQLLIPNYGDENQMLRCAGCDAEVGYDAGANKKLDEAADNERDALSSPRRALIRW